MYRQRREGRVCRLGKAMREFGDGCRLAGTIHADDKDNRRARFRDRDFGSALLECLPNLLRDDIEDLLKLNFACTKVGTDTIADLARHIATHIAANENRK